jgi:hypothetical protein
VLKFGEALENQMPTPGQINIRGEMLIAPFSNENQTLLNQKQSAPGW